MLEIAAPCRCNACNHGCKFGSGFLAEDDAKNIAGFLDIPEENLKKEFLEEIEQFNKKMLRPRLLRKGNQQHGQCVFYDEQK